MVNSISSTTPMPSTVTRPMDFIAGWRAMTSTPRPMSKVSAE